MLLDLDQTSGTENAESVVTDQKSDAGQNLGPEQLKLVKAIEACTNGIEGLVAKADQYEKGIII